MVSHTIAALSHLGYFFAVFWTALQLSSAHVTLRVLRKRLVAKKSARISMFVVIGPALSEVLPTRKRLDITKLERLGTTNGRFFVKGMFVIVRMGHDVC